MSHGSRWPPRQYRATPYQRGACIVDVPRSCASIWAVLQPRSEFMRVLCVEFAWEHHRLSRSGWSQARIVHLVGDCNRWYHAHVSCMGGYQHLVHHLSLVREYGLAFGREPSTRRGIERAVLIRESIGQGGHLDSTGRLRTNEGLVSWMCHARVHQYGRAFSHVASSCVFCVWNLHGNTTVSHDLGGPRPGSCT